MAITRSISRNIFQTFHLFTFICLSETDSHYVAGKSLWGNPPASTSQASATMLIQKLSSTQTSLQFKCPSTGGSATIQNTAAKIHIRPDGEEGDHKSIGQTRWLTPAIPAPEKLKRDCWGLRGRGKRIRSSRQAQAIYRMRLLFQHGVQTHIQAKHPYT